MASAVYLPILRQTEQCPALPHCRHARRQRMSAQRKHVNTPRPAPLRQEADADTDTHKNPSSGGRATTTFNGSRAPQILTIQSDSSGKRRGGGWGGVGVRARSLGRTEREAAVFVFAGGRIFGGSHKPRRWCAMGSMTQMAL